VPLRPRRLGFALIATCLLAGAPPASAAEGEALLALAFARAEAAADLAQPYHYHMETRTRISDGDDVLEQEERAWVDAIQWGPDSTQILAEGKELIYNRKAKPGENLEEKDEAEDKGEKKERKLELSFDFFTAERRADYRFEPGGLESRGDRELAVVALKPRAKRKELWAGKLWLEPATGALAAAELKPADGSFGVKHLDLTAELADHAGQDLPRWIAMDLEVKLPLIVHKHIRTRAEFSPLAPAP